jgi:hypothetical protein
MGRRNQIRDNCHGKRFSNGRIEESKDWATVIDKQLILEEIIDPEGNDAVLIEVAALGRGEERANGILEVGAGEGLFGRVKLRKSWGEVHQR